MLHGSGVSCGLHCAFSLTVFFSPLTQTTARLTHAGGQSGVSSGPDALEAESVATSELASYKERAEKLEEDLLVR